MRKTKLILIILFLFLFLVAACAGSGRDDPGDAAPVEPAGPVLIMFYTDN